MGATIGFLTRRMEGRPHRRPGRTRSGLARVDRTVPLRSPPRVPRRAPGISRTRGERGGPAAWASDLGWTSEISPRPVSRPMVERVSFDRVADVYDETRGLPPRVLAKAVAVLSQELEGERVLEIGVGTGRYAVPLQKSGVRVIGVDIAPKMVARGLEKGLRDVVFADGARLPFRE